jgi:hypothetical protein
VREGSSPLGNSRSHTDRLEILERICCGETQGQVACALGTTTRTVRRALAAAGGTGPPSPPSPRRARGVLPRCSYGTPIQDGRRLSGEVDGVAGRGRYRATRADDRACLAALRPKRSKPAASPRLRRAVVAMLERRFSPQQISARLRSGGARPLGGRPAGGQAKPLVHRHAGRAPDPLRAAEPPRQRRRHRDRDRQDRRADRAAARAAALVADLGPGPRDGAPPRVHRGHRRQGLPSATPTRRGSRAWARTPTGRRAGTSPSGPT